MFDPLLYPLPILFDHSPINKQKPSPNQVGQINPVHRFPHNTMVSIQLPYYEKEDPHRTAIGSYNTIDMFQTTANDSANMDNTVYCQFSANAIDEPEGTIIPQSSIQQTIMELQFNPTKNVRHMVKNIKDSTNPIIFLYCLAYQSWGNSHTQMIDPKLKYKCLWSFSLSNVSNTNKKVKTKESIRQTKLRKAAMWPTNHLIIYY